MRAVGRPLHIVYVFRGFPREWEESLVHEMRTLEALGHRVTAVSRLASVHREVWRAFSGIRGDVRLIREDDPLLHLKAIPSSLAVLLGSPLEYGRTLRAARSGKHPKMRRFLHAGMLAHRLRALGADHLHFLNGSSRMARLVASLSGLSYSVNSQTRDGSVRGGVSRFVSAGHHSNPRAVELLIRVTEAPRLPESTRRKPLVLVVGCPRELRESLAVRLRLRGFDSQEERSAGLAPDRLLDCGPDVVLAGADGDGGDAFRLLRQLRADPSVSHAPFFLITGRDDRELRLEAFRQGADGFFLASHDVEELVARIGSMLNRGAGRGRTHRRRRGITGQLEHLPLPEIVQLLNLGKRTACVTLSSGGGQGKIWFDDGELVHATLGTADGEAAFYALLRWKDGEFSIQHGVEAPRQTIENDAMFLVINGLRHVDEEALAAS